MTALPLIHDEPAAANDRSSFFITRRFGIVPYEQTWQAMREFTDARDDTTPDELWCLQHLPVFTLGQAGKREHILNAGDIPVIETDRGGQVTYHGPGQLVIYPLFDLNRLTINIRAFVHLLEQAVIDLLAEFKVDGCRREGAPGVYVDDAKIASIGLRVRRGRCYHGLAFNVDMDLEPFSRINPCGIENLAVSDLMRLGVKSSISETCDMLLRIIKEQLVRR